jgi:hypothetical protein
MASVGFKSNSRLNKLMLANETFESSSRIFFDEIQKWSKNCTIFLVCTWGFRP